MSFSFYSSRHPHWHTSLYFHISFGASACQKTIIQGRLSTGCAVFTTSITIAGVFLRRCLGHPLDPHGLSWFEIGTLFWRRQFNYAMRLQNIEEAREYMDSFYSVLDNVDDVTDSTFERRHRTAGRLVYPKFVNIIGHHAVSAWWWSGFTWRSRAISSHSWHRP